MSDDPGRLDEDGSQTDGTVKRAGRARICKQCRFTTTDAREFSNHRLHAHAEENTEEKTSSNRKTGAKRRTSSALSVSAEETKNKGTAISKIEDIKVVDNIETNANNETNKSDLTPKVLDDIPINTISKEILIVENQDKNILDIPESEVDSTKVAESAVTVDTETKVDPITEADQDMKMESPRMSDELLQSLALAPRKPNNEDDDKKNSATEKVLIEKQNGMTEEVLLIKRDEDVDEEPRLVIADSNDNDIHHRGLKHSGLYQPSLDSSLNERELQNFKEHSSFNGDYVNGEEEMDYDGPMEEEEDEEVAGALNGASSSLTPHIGAPVEKKKRIRQEVDPLKYFEVMDENGVKYACSKCGNVYKWRKSLNKHWKEKHFGEVPDLTKPPPTLQNFTLFSRYKPKAGGQPPPPAAPNVVYGAAIPSPTNQQKSRVTPTSKPDSESRDLSNLMMPRQIGPFISSSPDLFHSQLLSLATQAPRMPENHHEMRKMIDELQRRSNALKGKKLQFPDRTSPYQEVSQNEPIDYSKPLDFSKKPDVKSEPNWGDNNSESADSLPDIPLSMAQANSQIALAMKQTNPVPVDGDSPVLQCTKCSFVAKTLVDYSAHMSLHLNKRAFKCAECQAHFNGIDDLNKHFLEQHSEKIQEHKEAIQKIPHGLQQTYHLLKMPLDSISNLSTQELLSNEPKQLKCSMCSFVAKWPAELQKHAVSHSEERPFVCMVCGSTYKWKWDLVKHFEKSHSALPNPYKRREGGGIIASGTSSPSTPPLESISRAATALMDAGMNSTNYVMDVSDTPPLKKRRLSETEMQDTENFYRELLERQIKHRREMVHLSESMQLPTRPSSSPFNKDSENGKDGYQSSDSMDSLTPKHQVAEALKHRIKTGNQDGESPKDTPRSGKSEVPLPYKCSVCDYRARWPSEISQHMKNHSNEKPFHCPRCSYKSKWKWDVVKHLRRCGGGTVHDVIDTTKLKKMAPPNVMVLPQGNSHQPQQAQQPLKTPPTFSAFSPSQRAKSLSPAINNLARLTGTNFSLASEGQDHKTMLDMISQNGLQGNSLNGKPSFSPPESDGLFRCHECPFVGNSHAELKRHAVLHSENKPFSCNMCGYSSRWKCDLKKHMKVYNHFNTSISNPEDPLPVDVNDKYVEVEEEEDSDEEKSTLYMCPQCPYNSYKKSAFDHHLLIHGNLITPDNDVEPVAPTQTQNNSLPTPSKFKCTKCDYQGNDLSSFLRHKQAHASGAIPVVEKRQSVSPVRSEPRSVSPAPSEVSNRTLHLKHRRKPIKQFRCSKCPYICFKYSALENHSSLHESQGNDAYLCMFCDYNVFSKNLLLQHMRLHPEYNPAEGEECDNRVSAAELMEMEELEEKELAGDDRKDPSIPEENNNIDEYESGIDFIAPSSSQNSDSPPPLSLPVSFERSPENNNLKESAAADGGLPCEWCPATFPNVVTLYQHAQSLHPSQLKAQEAGDIAAKQAPGKTSQLEQIVRERQREYQVYHQTAVQQTQMFNPYQNQYMNKLMPLAPKPEIGSEPTNSEDELMLAKQQMSALNARKSASQQKRGRSFQCTKCSFTAPNAVTYLRHIERHGSNCKHTCLYCDYSIDRLNLLYQHMKGTHGSKWMGTTEDKIHMTVGAEDSNNNIIDVTQMDEESMDELNGSYSRSSNDFLEEYYDMKKSALEELQKQALAEQLKLKTNYLGLETSPFNNALTPKSGPKPVLQLKGNTLFKGILLQVCYLNRRKHYKCPRCSYINNNAANTANHVKQHGQNRKYTCRDCDYSVDNYKHIQHHIETVHPIEPTYVMMDSSPSTLVIDDFPEEIGQQQNQTDGDVEMQVCDQLNKRAVQDEQMEVSSSDRVELYPDAGDDDNEMDEDKTSEAEPVFGETENTAEGIEDETEVALMEEELKQTYNQLNDKDDTNANPDIAADNEISDKTIEESSEVLKSNHEDKIRYVCNKCPYKSQAIKSFKCHVQMHGLARKYRCDYCDWSTERLNLICQHRRVHASEPGFDPNPGDIKFLNRDYLLENKGNSDNNVYFAMMKNQNKFTSSSNEKLQHIKKSGQKQHNCKICPFSTEDLNAASYHKRLHCMQALYNCSECSYSINNMVALKEHIKLHQKERQMLKLTLGDDTNRQKCPKCPYNSPNKNLLVNHITLHSSGRKYACPDCDFSTDKLKLLEFHLKVHEEGYSDSDSLEEEITLLLKNNPDTIGPRLYFSMSNLNELDSDSNDTADLDLTCDQCPFSTPSKDELGQHIQHHDSQTKSNLKCTFCTFSCTNEEELLQHAQVHFPSMKLDLDTMKQLRKQNNSYRKNLSRSFHGGNAGEDDKSSDDNGEPDSTVSDPQLAEGDKTFEEQEKTKVYVCQFCEREFHCKTTMLQHEKQHLVGS